MRLDEAYAELAIVQDFIPRGASNRPGRQIAPVSITVHNTDNDSPRANAAAHARYVKGADAQRRKVSWHFTVDDASVFQHLPTSEKGWHAGNDAGNNTSVGVEICMNPELDVARTYDRAALLVAVLARRLAIQVPSGIFQHNHWTGKDCPVVLRHKTNGWRDFLAKVAQKYASIQDVEAADLGSFAGGQDDHQG
jgi:N-acetylmuramoyl-L-alanine amidase CwlA